MIRRHLYISGRVQGVYYRHSTAQQAAQIGGLSGWVRNLPDGRVEALIEGPEQAVEQLIAWCHQGPPLAQVKHIDIQAEPPSGDLRPFGAHY